MRIVLTTLALAALSATAVLAADAKQGKTAYDKSCKSCHGADGAGNPSYAKMMKMELRGLGSAEVQALSDADLKKAITNGTGKMKPVTAVTGSAVDDVVAYVRTMKK